MKKIKFASWVVGSYLDWARDYLDTRKEVESKYDTYKRKINDSLTEYEKRVLEDELPDVERYLGSRSELILDILSREDFKPKLSTLKSLTYELFKPEILCPELYFLEHLTAELFLTSQLCTPPSSEIDKAVDSFKHATITLFRLIEKRDRLDINDIFIKQKEAVSLEGLDENIAKFFTKKVGPQEVLLEYAEDIRKKANLHSPLWLSNGREPTGNLIKIRTLVYSLIRTTGDIERVKSINGIIAFVGYMVGLTQVQKSPMPSNEIEKRFKSACKIWEKEMST